MAQPPFNGQGGLSGKRRVFGMLAGAKNAAAKQFYNSLLFEPVVAGGDQTAAIAETAATDHNQTAGLLATASIAETTAATHSQSATAQAAAVVTESATPGDSQTASIATAAVVAETATATTSQSAGIAAQSAIVETTAATASQDATVTAAASVGETSAASDSLSAVSGVPVVATLGNNTANTYSGTQDNGLNSPNPTTNQSALTEIQATKYAVGAEEATAIRFTGIGSIPSNAVILSANLVLTLTQQTLDTVVNANRLLVAWDNATSTWEESSAGVAWNTGGAGGDGIDRVATPTGSVSIVNGQAGQVTINLTADVAGMVVGTLPNNGWLLERALPAFDTGFTYFASSENTDGLRPFLSLSYIIPGVVASVAETAAATHSQGAGLSAQAVVSETVVSGHTQAASQNLAANLAEPAAATASQSATASTAATVAETAAAGDSQTTSGGVQTASLAESSAATETQSAGLAAQSVLSETVAASHSQAASTSAAATVSETSASAHSQTAAASATGNVAEATAASHGQSAILDAVASVGETAVSNASQAVALIQQAVVVESAATGDSQTAISVIQALIAESAIVLDQAIADLSQAAEVIEACLPIDAVSATGGASYPPMPWTRYYELVAVDKGQHLIAFDKTINLKAISRKRGIRIYL